jgi:hypothetical protein
VGPSRSRALFGDTLPDHAVELQRSYLSLIVGLDAAVRHLLVVTAELARFLEKGDQPSFVDRA